jgi:hypothetical protein
MSARLAGPVYRVRYEQGFIQIRPNLDVKLVTVCG